MKKTVMVAVVVLAFSCVAQADDVIVSSVNQTLVDPEFSEGGLWMSWGDRDGNVWMNDVNASGRWYPRHGRETLIDTGLVPVGSIRQGPEWCWSSTGSRIVYSKVGAQGVTRMFSAHYCSGEWTVTRMPKSAGRNIIQASKDSGDDRPRVIWTTASGLVGWREIDDDATDEVIGFADELTNMIFVVGHRSIVCVKGGQVATYNLDTGEWIQITDDGFGKRWPRAYIADDGSLVVAVVLDDVCIGVYRDGNLERLIRPTEASYPFLFAPKLYFHGGIPLVSYLASTTTSGKVQNKSGDSEVWISPLEVDSVSIRTSNPLITRLKDSEPVSFFGGKSFVYYAEILEDRRRLIHRTR